MAAIPNVVGAASLPGGLFNRMLGFITIAGAVAAAARAAVAAAEAAELAAAFPEMLLLTIDVADGGVINACCSCFPTFIAFFYVQIPQGKMDLVWAIGRVTSIVVGKQGILRHSCCG